METLAPELLRRVSYHAVTRYCQRILNVVVAAGPRQPPAHEYARLHCEAAGRTVEAIRSEILTPAVAAACLTGMTMVNTGRFSARISGETGIVTTIYEPRRRQTKKLRLLGVTELKRKSHRDGRRAKRALPK